MNVEALGVVGDGEIRDLHRGIVSLRHAPKSNGRRERAQRALVDLEPRTARIHDRPPQSSATVTAPSVASQTFTAFAYRIHPPLAASWIARHDRPVWRASHAFDPCPRSLIHSSSVITPAI